MNVQSVDLGHEIRQGVQFRLALAPVVLGRPIERELLNRCELHALRCIGDGLPLGPLSCVYSPAQFGKFRLGKSHAKRTNRILVGGLVAAFCSDGLGHGASSFGRECYRAWDSIPSIRNARRESHQTHTVGSIGRWCCPIPWYEPREWMARAGTRSRVSAVQAVKGAGESIG